MEVKIYDLSNIEPRAKTLFPFYVNKNVDLGHTTDIFIRSRYLLLK